MAQSNTVTQFNRSRQMQYQVVRLDTRVGYGYPGTGYRTGPGTRLPGYCVPGRVVTYSIAGAVSAMELFPGLLLEILRVPGTGTGTVRYCTVPVIY